MRAHAYKLSEGVRFAAHDDGLLIFEAREGKLFRLNRTAAIMWRMVEDGHPLEEIVDQISSEFDLTRDVGLRHVEEFIAHLKSNSLIVDSK